MTLCVHVCSLQTTFHIDVWQEAGGQLSPAEAAALQRWKDATASTAQQAADAGPWVTKEDLNSVGLINNPYHVQVCCHSFVVLKRSDSA